MNYPKPLHKGDTIGICAPSSGVTVNLHPRLDGAKANIEALGYRVVETESVRRSAKCVSADAGTRAAEFMHLYTDPDVAAIIPPWGGEFLMDILPLLDFARLSALPPKWVCGYSDITTLTFVLTVLGDVATVHGSNLMNMGYGRIHTSDLAAFTAMSAPETTRQSSTHWGRFSDAEFWAGGNPPDAPPAEAYILDQETRLTALGGEETLRFQGRLIGGCMDVLCKILGTPFAPVDKFLEKYAPDGFIWTLESCEMHAADIYHTLWQMGQCGWFAHCNGVLMGRPDGYADTMDFTFTDALEQTLGPLGIPVIYGADIGHIPPQMQIVNGAYGTVEFEHGALTLRQVQKR